MTKQTALATAVESSIGRAVHNVAEQPDTRLLPEDAYRLSEQVSTELAKQPAVQHATNTEPWYQSRVTIGALAAIFSGIGGVLTVAETQGLSAAAMWPFLTTIGGGLFTLYGRWMATAPLGAKPDR